VPLEPASGGGVLRVTTVDQRPDEELLAEHLAGIAGAFDALVARYIEDLYGFFQRFVGNSAAAEDLVQETFLQVHLAAGAFDPSRTFKPWLYTIAANKGRDHLRARGRRPTHSLDASSGGEDSPAIGGLLPAADADAVEHVADEEQARLVRATIDQMPEPQRLVLVLGYYQRLPYAEIADILAVPVGTVKSRLHTAVSQFAKLWRARAEAATPEG
jgi:RNA polymerase sigma-70 factor (ECF subfamily)